MTDVPPDQSEPPILSLTDTELAFIEEHFHDDINQLILRSNSFKGIDVKKLANQIQARQKALKKLPNWSSQPKLLFPPALSVEQSSSEATALFKSSLVSGKKLIDITGGMGVDCYYMSKGFETATYFELQKEVAATAAYNFNILNANKIKVCNADSLITIEKDNLQADWIYADPARRDNNKDKVVRLADCTPDVVSNLELLQNAAPHILIKTSPLLDINLAVRELRNVKSVYVVGYDQECKELLFHIDREHHSEHYDLKVRIINAAGNAEQLLDFDKSEEQSASINYSYPLAYLYEPHAAVLKSGAFKLLGQRYGVSKLAPSSHLYTSQEKVANFPGRTFEITGYCKPDGTEIQQLIGQNKANLTLRNFPAKIQDLRKKWRLNEGGEFYLFATTLFSDKKIVVVTRK
jgi:hypothetical protein